LNRCFQQGKTPTEYDLTDRILNYAHFLETKSDSSHTSEVSKPIIFLSESTNQNQMVDVVANPIFSYSDSKNRTSDDDDDLLRKKKKKKKNINRDFGMGT
jgi:vesicle coat complex subunit